MSLNPEQIDNTSKTLQDLQARCVADPETHSVRGKVRNAQ